MGKPSRNLQRSLGLPYLPKLLGWESIVLISCFFVIRTISGYDLFQEHSGQCGLSMLVRLECYGTVMDHSESGECWKSRTRFLAIMCQLERLLCCVLFSSPPLEAYSWALPSVFFADNTNVFERNSHQRFLDYNVVCLHGNYLLRTRSVSYLSHIGFH